MRLWSFFWTLIGVNVRASLALKRSFLLQMSFMLANNFIFFMFWWLFFRKVPEVRGWTYADVTLLYGIVAGAYGLTVVLFGGVRNLSRLIEEGGLDSYLTQPKPVLLQTLCSRSFAAGWGDLATALILIGASVGYTSGRGLLAIVLMLSGALVLLASGVLLSSLSFWIPRLESFSRQVVEFLITFAMYPMHIYDTVVRGLLFTVLPAAYLGFLPVQILREERLELWLWQLGASLVYLVLACLLFRSGLRRYQSGNRIMTRV